MLTVIICGWWGLCMICFFLPFFHHLRLSGPHRIWLLPCLSSHKMHCCLPSSPAAFCSWNISGSNPPQGPCLSFPPAQNLQILPCQPLVTQVLAQMIVLQGSFPYQPTPPHTHWSLPSQYFSLLKISLLCTYLLSSQ